MYLNFLRRNFFLKNNLFLAYFVFSFFRSFEFYIKNYIFCSFFGFGFVLSKMFWHWTPTLNFRVKNIFFFPFFFGLLVWNGSGLVNFGFILRSFLVHHRNFFLVVQMLLLFSDFEFRFDGLYGFRIKFVSKILVDWVPDWWMVEIFQVFHRTYQKCLSAKFFHPSWSVDFLLFLPIWMLKNASHWRKRANAYPMP